MKKTKQLKKKYILTKVHPQISTFLNSQEAIIISFIKNKKKR